MPLSLVEQLELQQRYVYLACDLITGAVREELPLVGVVGTRLLNDDGQFTASMVTAHLGQAARRSLILATESERSTVVVVRDGTPLGEWMLHQRPTRDNDATPVALQGKEITSYLKRVIFQAQTYAAVDQLQIAWDLVAACDDPPAPWSFNGTHLVPAGSRAMAMAMPTRASQVSGVLRSRTYDQTTYKNCGDLLTELSAVENGFDFDIDISYDASGNLQRVPSFSYPSRGRDNGIILEQPGPGLPGGNITTFGQAEDGTQVSTVAVAIGAGQGTSQIVAASVNTGLLAVYPLLHSTRSYTTVSESATLQGHADADAAATSSPRVPPALTLLADADPVLGSINHGDTVHVKLDPSYNYPDGMSEALRVTGQTFTPVSTGPETYSLTVALIGA